METCSHRHASHLFTVYPERKEMAAYASDLCANHSTGEVARQVYDDACDIGFVIVSGPTGKEATFAQDNTRRDGEGDIIAWTYVPTRGTLRKLPQLNGWKVTVIND